MLQYLLIYYFVLVHELELQGFLFLLLRLDGQVAIAPPLTLTLLISTPKTLNICDNL